MAMMAHVCDARDAAAILRSGLKLPKRRRFVFATPVLPNFLATHQWGRELRRGGYRSSCVVQFRVPDDEPVLVGPYIGPHTPTTAAGAVAALMNAADPLGWEVRIPRAIHPREIVRIRPLSPVVGWRYCNRRVAPCGCDVCGTRGQIKGGRFRKPWLAEEKALAEANRRYELEHGHGHEHGDEDHDRDDR